MFMIEHDKIWRKSPIIWFSNQQWISYYILNFVFPPFVIVWNYGYYWLIFFLTYTYLFLFGFIFAELYLTIIGCSLKAWEVHMYCTFRKFGEGKQYKKHMVITNNIIDIVGAWGVISHIHTVSFFLKLKLNFIP